MMRTIDRIYGGIHIKTVYEVALCPACIAQSEMTERISLPLNENRPWFVSGLQFSAAVVYAVRPARIIYDNESIRFVPSLRLTEAGVDSAIANLNCHDIVATNLTTGSKKQDRFAPSQNDPTMSKIRQRVEYLTRIKQPLPPVSGSAGRRRCH